MQSPHGCSLADRIVVLTGGIGCGKSLVAERLATKGITIVDADEISHRLTGPSGRAIAPIREALGDAVITTDQRLDRPKVRALVFADPSARARLEAILHPMIQEEAASTLRAATGPYAIYMVPLWVEKQPQNQADPAAQRLSPAAVVVVDCEEEVQIARVMKRSGLSRDQVQAIMATQASRQARCLAADHILNNNGTVEDLCVKIDALHERLIHS